MRERGREKNIAALMFKATEEINKQNVFLPAKVSIEALFVPASEAYIFLK